MNAPPRAFRVAQLFSGASSVATPILMVLGYVAISARTLQVIIAGGTVGHVLGAVIAGVMFFAVGVPLCFWFVSYGRLLFGQLRAVRERELYGLWPVFQPFVVAALLGAVAVGAAIVAFPSVSTLVLAVLLAAPVGTVAALGLRSSRTYLRSLVYDPA